MSADNQPIPFVRDARSLIRIDPVGATSQRLAAEFNADSVVTFDRDYSPRLSRGQVRLHTDNLRFAAFDADGTLYHTEPALRESIFRGVEHYVSNKLSGRSYVLHDLAKVQMEQGCFGISDPEMCERLRAYLVTYLRESNDEQLRRVSALLNGYTAEAWVPEFQALRGQFYPAALKSHGKIMPGAAQMVVNCARVFEGKIGLYTGSSQLFALPAIDNLLEPELRRLGTTAEQVLPDHYRVFADQIGRGMGKPLSHGYDILVHQQLFPDEEEAQRIGLQDRRLLRGVGFTDRPNDMVAMLSAGFSRVVCVPEDLNLRPFLDMAGEHAKYSYLNWVRGQLAGAQAVDPSRILIVGSLNNVILEKRAELRGVSGPHISRPSDAGEQH